MKLEDIYNKWTSFITDPKYKEYFLNNDIIWYGNLSKIKKYIDDNNKIPSQQYKDKQIKFLGCWIGTQKNNYKTKLNIMKKEDIYNKWTLFINDDKYKEYFLDSNIIWYNTLEEVKKYIDDNNKRPSNKNINKKIKHLGCWILNQQKKYKKKI